MLSFNVAQLEKGPVGATRDYQIDDSLTVEGVGINVKGDIKFTRTPRSVLVKADFKTILPQECCRCLNEYQCSLDVRFEEEFLPTLDVASGLPLDIEEAEQSFTIDEHHILDISDALRQYIILAQPMKPLCRADCPGINTMQ